MPRTKSPEARQRALVGAQAVLLERGLVDFTVDEVAERSGVAKTTIYRHWANRTALLHDTIGSVLPTHVDTDTGSLRGDMERLMGEFCLEASRPEGRTLMAGMLHASMDDPEVAELFAALLDEHRRPAAAAVERAIARGELPVDTDVDLTLDLIAGPLIARAMVRGQPVTEADLRAILTHAFTGLGV